MLADLPLVKAEVQYIARGNGTRHALSNLDNKFSTEGVGGVHRPGEPIYKNWHTASESLKTTEGHKAMEAVTKVCRLKNDYSQ